MNSPERSVKQYLFWLSVAIVVIFIDQVTKYAAEISLTAYKPQAVLPFLNLTLAYNKGAAFSFLGSAGGWQQWFFIGLGIVVSVVILIWLYRLPKQKKLEACGLSLVLAGAVGNLIDRIAQGMVVDFIHLHYQQYSWPVFNVADIAISVGIFLLLLDMLRHRHP